MMLCASVIDAICDTPLVELSRLCQALELNGRILAKLDYLLPGHSKKDRAARAGVEHARETGALRRGARGGPPPRMSLSPVRSQSGKASPRRSLA